MVLACQPARTLQLTAGQARGTACIRCAATGPAELLPVGVIAPPVPGSGIALACPACVTAVLTPQPAQPAGSSS